MCLYYYHYWTELSLRVFSYIRGKLGWGTELFPLNFLYRKIRFLGSGEA